MAIGIGHRSMSVPIGFIGRHSEVVVTAARPARKVDVGLSGGGPMPRVWSGLALT
jgi:hypothetical protein